MATFLYRCPKTGFNIQGWIADAAEGADTGAYVSVDCPLCGLIHVVSRANGKSPSEEESAKK